VRYSFDSFDLDTVAFELRQQGGAIAVEPQILRLLIHLIEHRDRLLTRDDLIAAIWQGRAVSDWTVSGAI